MKMRLELRLYKRISVEIILTITSQWAMSQFCGATLINKFNRMIRVQLRWTLVSSTMFTRSLHEYLCLITEELVNSHNPVQPDLSATEIQWIERMN